MNISIGKWRGLQQTADSRGTFSILAIDHRGNLRKAINPDQPERVSDMVLVNLKQEITAALAPVSSAVLIDPEIGGGQCVASRALPGNTGLIMALEATGYTGDAGARTTRILPGWSAAKARCMGAAAVKLLVYYHPDAPNASAQEQIIRETAEACQQLDLAFFVEPLSYSPDPSQQKLPADELGRVVIETARRLTMPGVDVLKVEFPVDVTEETDEKIWAAACAELTAACPIPWLLLSAGVDYDTYLRQVRVACEAGASGVMAGRAVWKEATRLEGEARRTFLNTIARERMARLTALCTALARPFTAIYDPPEISGDWYREYCSPVSE